jgi:hypothetical protein
VIILTINATVLTLSSDCGNFNLKMEVEEREPPTLRSSIELMFWLMAFLVCTSISFAVLAKHGIAFANIWKA